MLSYLGMDPDAQNRYSQTALMLAARTGDIQLLQLLLQFGKAVNFTSNSSSTEFCSGSNITSRGSSSTSRLVVLLAIDFYHTHFAVLMALRSSLSASCVQINYL